MGSFQPRRAAATCPVAAALCLSVASAQAPAPDARLLQAIADLTDQERAVDAMRVLCRRGGEAVAVLMRELEDPAGDVDKARRAFLLYVLGKLGKEAMPAARLVLAELRSSDPQVLRNACWALGEIGPYAQAAGIDVLTPLSDFKAVPGVMYQEWAFACERIQVGLDLADSDLIERLRSQSHAALAAASGVLCRRSRPLSADVTEALTQAWEQILAHMARYGSASARGGLEVARAVAQYLPASPHAAAARASLVHHFDVEVRLQAVMDAGQHPEHAPVAVPGLLLALEDGSPFVRREAVTALGMLGGAAKGAIPALRVASRDADAQVRARAEAALRAIAPPVNDR